MLHTHGVITTSATSSSCAPVNEFKQIIGRGTRLYDGKDYFTIYDFVKAYHHFSDPEWDGEPLEPEPKPRPSPLCRPNHLDPPRCPTRARKKSK